MIDVVHSNILISGKRGSGKSFFFENVVYPRLRNRNTVILDCKNQYRFAGEIIVDDAARPYEAFCDAVEDLPTDKPFHLRAIVYDPSEDALDFYARIVGDMSHVTFVVEEFHAYVRNKYTTPRSFSHLIRLKTGKHNRDISVILITHYATDFPKEVHGNIDYTILFYQNNKILTSLHNSGYIEQMLDFKQDAELHPKGYVGQYYVLH